MLKAWEINAVLTIIHLNNLEQTGLDKWFQRIIEILNLDLITDSLYLSSLCRGHAAAHSAVSVQVPGQYSFYHTLEKMRVKLHKPGG